MIETTTGLPNTCSQCGQPAGSKWCAEHEDAARSGAGICAGCHAEEAAPAGGIDTPQEDDLTAIQGIGQVTQSDLRSAGVYTYRDLAEADPAELAGQVAGSQATVSKWIREAQALA